MARDIDHVLAASKQGVHARIDDAPDVYRSLRWKSYLDQSTRMVVQIIPCNAALTPAIARTRFSRREAAAGIAGGAFAGPPHGRPWLVHLKAAQSPSVIERVAVKTSLTATLTLLAFTSLAHAQPIQRIVPAGKTTVVFTYRPYNRWTCDGASGVVKLFVKPQHGRVAHHLTPTTIPTMSRFTHGPTGCPPKPTTG